MEVSIAPKKAVRQSKLESNTIFNVGIVINCLFKQNSMGRPSLSIEEIYQAVNSDNPIISIEQVTKIVDRLMASGTLIKATEGNGRVSYYFFKYSNGRIQLHDPLY